jgi:CHAT domain-containing protein
LVFFCDPKAASLSALDDEAQAVQDAFPRTADVRLVRNLDAQSLQQELLARPPRFFLFLGHTNVSLDGNTPTLAFTDRRRNLVAVKPASLSALLGSFSPAHGGPLSLVFLNGCESESLGRAVFAAGVPTVICWKTCVENGAAAVFSQAFFSAHMTHGCTTAAAFEQARQSVRTDAPARRA